MKCPHCEYMDGYDYEKMAVVKGEVGEFFTLPITMRRDGLYYRKEERRVLGCPSCNKIFMDDN